MIDCKHSHTICADCLSDVAPLDRPVSEGSREVAKNLVAEYYSKGAITGTSDVWLIDRITTAIETAKPKVSKDGLQAARLLVATSVGHEFENELLIQRIAEYGASQRPKVSEDDEKTAGEIVARHHCDEGPQERAWLAKWITAALASVRDAARLAGEQGLREVAYFLEPHFHGAKGRHMTAKEAIALIKDISSELDDAKDTLEVAVLAERKRIPEAEKEGERKCFRCYKPLHPRTCDCGIGENY